MMSRRATLIITALAVIAAGGLWLHLDIVPDIRWSNGNGLIYGGWMAIVKAWPVWLIAGGSAAAIGIVTGSLFGETARVNDHKKKASEADSRATEAELIAENATQSAEAALANEHSCLQRQQKEAREQIAQAKSAQKTTVNEIEQYREQNTALHAEHEKMERRLRKSLEAQNRGRTKIKALRQSPTPSLEAAYEEVHRHQNIIANTRSRSGDLDFGQPHWMDD